MMRKLLALVVLAILVSGCTASRAFRKGEDAIRRSDWDTAVEHFTTAVQSDPDNGEFKIHLRRAQEEAARAHLEKARDFERNDQLDQALAEYRKALQMMGTDRV